MHLTVPPGNGSAQAKPSSPADEDPSPHRIVAEYGAAVHPPVAGAASVNSARRQLASSPSITLSPGWTVNASIAAAEAGSASPARRHAAADAPRRAPRPPLYVTRSLMRPSPSSAPRRPPPA